MWMKDGCKVGCVKAVVGREGGLLGTLQPHGVLFTGEKSVSGNLSIPFWCKCARKYVPCIAIRQYTPRCHHGS